MCLGEHEKAIDLGWDGDMDFAASLLAGGDGTAAEADGAAAAADAAAGDAAAVSAAGAATHASSKQLCRI